MDPFKDEQDLFVMARVTIQNVGNQPLTNVRANFGGGNIQEPETLIPGQKNHHFSTSWKRNGVCYGNYWWRNFSK